MADLSCDFAVIGAATAGLAAERAVAADRRPVCPHDVGRCRLDSVETSDRSGKRCERMRRPHSGPGRMGAFGRRNELA
jgi:hypothetical protein